METDSNTLKNCIDQRNIELERYRGEISGMFADTDELESERTALVRTLEEIKRSNTMLKTELSKLAE
jgi:cell division protein FtsB